ncbi:hypothetical protein DdX_13447 [Ditylenchus destructor]|uniref:Uncharacterized protein n=1 Tax=Ditylenchus destructor TaxID=166010 RepID=A0AAD4MSS9_9BILA|nr:hypothetical protein DdX_13447 [Ditylenchus destructor]
MLRKVILGFMDSIRLCSPDRWLLSGSAARASHWELNSSLPSAIHSLAVQSSTSAGGWAAVITLFSAATRGNSFGIVSAVKWTLGNGHPSLVGAILIESEAKQSGVFS